MRPFVGGFPCRQTEQAFGPGADRLLNEISGVNQGHRHQGDSFKRFHKSFFLSSDAIRKPDRGRSEYWKAPAN
jgi:hypothetical protein